MSVKKKLQRIGVHVRYPQGDSILADHDGIPVTFTPGPDLTFYDVELNYLESIATSNLHIVHNKFSNNLGYIGESASLEMGHALLYNRPIYLLYAPKYSSSAPKKLVDVLKKNEDKFFIIRIDCVQDDDLAQNLHKIAQTQIHYALSQKEILLIKKFVQELLASYKLR